MLDNVRQAAPLGVVALGQALMLMMGRLDLSVGATAGLANVVLAIAFAGLWMISERILNQFA